MCNFFINVLYFVVSVLWRKHRKLANRSESQHYIDYIMPSVFTRSASLASCFLARKAAPLR